MTITRRSVLKSAAIAAGGFAAAIGLPYVVLGSGKKHVFLIVADAMRGDVLGTTVDGLEVTPCLNQLAQKGVFFRNAFSGASATKSSVASIFSGLYPPGHGVEYPMYTLPDCLTLPRFLSKHGYINIGIVSNPYLNSEIAADGSKRPMDFGFNSSFDSYLLVDAHVDTAQTRLRHFEAYGRGDWVNKHFWRRLDRHTDLRGARGGGSVFGYLHYMDSHQPWVKSSPVPGITGIFHSEEATVDVVFGRDADLITKILITDEPKQPIWSSMTEEEIHRLRSIYYEACRYVDECIRNFLLELKRRRIYDRSILIITSDHGDELMEHGMVGHGKNLFNTSLHVPLVISGSEFRESEIERRVSNVMILPTMMEVFGGTHPAQTCYSLFSGGGSGRGADEEIFASLWGMDKIITPEGAVAMQHKANIDDATEVLYFGINDDPGEKIHLRPAERPLRLLRIVRNASERYREAAGIVKRFSTFDWQNPYVLEQNSAAEAAIAAGRVDRESAAYLKSVGAFIDSRGTPALHRGAAANVESLPKEMVDQLRALGYLN